MESCEQPKQLVIFEILVNEQIHQLDRLKNLMDRLRAIRESVVGVFPEKAECGGSVEQEKSCFLDKAMKVNSDICTELRYIEQELAHLESICGCCPKISDKNLDGVKARFHQVLR